MSARGFASALIVVLLSATSWAGTGLPTVTHDGRPYVELSRVAASLQTKLDATPVPHRIESRGPREARARLLGFGKGARVEGIHDGLIAGVRLERAGAVALLRVVFEGAAGTIRPPPLADPPRLVLDVARPAEP